MTAKPPKHIGDFYEQLRPPIEKSKGSTDSERYLAKLADRTFLNLWSYPNPYRSQKLGGAGDGKEVCDLLVVCDPHILIFSEKDIKWTEKPIDVAWPRWFRRSVIAAATQLQGAERWINEFPDRVFLDKLCAVPFPLTFPIPDQRRVHRIVVARGAKDACRKYFNGGLGTFVIKPELKGNDHADPRAESYLPFAIGDLDPAGNFVHVFDEASLDIVIGEFDTISDFTDYLDKRAAFIRSGKLLEAHGEEDLVAYYSIRINEQGDHDFTPPDGHSWDEIDAVMIGAGHWSRYISNPQYLAKKEADRVSYAWDRLIETFTDHMIGGTSIVLPGHSYSLTNSELAVRYMALERRYVRRAHSEAILDALEIGRKKQVFFRAMMGAPNSRENETGFFFLTLKYLDWMDNSGGYEKYREFRTFYLQTYSHALLMRHHYLKRVIGIAMEPPGQGRGASEDISYARQMEWTDEQRKQNREDCKALGIMGELKERRYSGEEFPDVRQPQAVGTGNRKLRRGAAARQRKQRKKKELRKAPDG